MLRLKIKAMTKLYEAQELQYQRICKDAHLECPGELVRRFFNLENSYTSLLEKVYEKEKATVQLTKRKHELKEELEAAQIEVLRVDYTQPAVVEDDSQAMKDECAKLEVCKTRNFACKLALESFKAHAERMAGLLNLRLGVGDVLEYQTRYLFMLQRMRHEFSQLP